MCTSDDLVGLSIALTDVSSDLFVGAQ